MKDIEMDFEEFHDTQVTDTLFNKDDVMIRSMIIGHRNYQKVV